MSAKAVVRDVGRVLNYPYTYVDSVAKLIPNELGITLRPVKESLIDNNIEPGTKIFLIRILLL